MGKIIETPLCKLAFKFGTDKCPRVLHNYTPFYYELLKDRRKKIKKVLEMGIGTQKVMAGSGDTFKVKNYRYQRGASLKMWRDFFPNAHIYGADNDPKAIFQQKRITTFICDERDKKDIENLVKKTGSDIDLFVDDGSHSKDDQIFLARTILPLLKKDVVYIIEDVGFPNHIVRSLEAYHCTVPALTKYVPHTTKDRLVVVKK